jgi:mannan endo-1,4-beta-mannosidase
MGYTSSVTIVYLDSSYVSHPSSGWIVWRLVSRQDSGHYPVDEHDQFDIRNDESMIWNILKAATAQAAQIRNIRRSSEAVGEHP